MKIKTKLKDKPCVVFFAYETWNGCYCECFGNYEDAWNNAIKDEVYMVGFLKNLYYGSSERIDEVKLDERPTIKQVKDFMKDCYRIVEA